VGAVLTEVTEETEDTDEVIADVELNKLVTEDALDEFIADVELNKLVTVDATEVEAFRVGHVLSTKIELTV